MAAVETASNLGGGAGVFKQKVGTDLEFRGIEGASGLIVYERDDTLSIDYAPIVDASGILDLADATDPDASTSRLRPEYAQGRNVGAGSGIFKQKVGPNLEFKSLKGANGLQIYEESDLLQIDYAPIIAASDITVTADSTEEDASYSKLLPQDLTGYNVGTGAQIFRTKEDNQLQFRTLKSSPCMTVVQTDTEITFGMPQPYAADTIDVTADSTDFDTSSYMVCAESNGATNIGGGVGLFSGTTGPILEFKSLVPGTGVTLTDLGDEVRINSGTLPWYDVTAHGAVGDGITDATSAVMATIAAMPSTGGVLYFPSGTYCLSAPLTISGISTFLRGDGYGLTKLKWVAPGGLHFSNALHETQIQDLTLLTDQVSGGTAIMVEGGFGGGAADSLGVTIENVRITGTGLGYWSIGVHISECPRSSVRNLQVNGAPGGTGATLGSFLALLIFSANGASDFDISNCHASNCQIGLALSGSPTPPQNVRVIGNIFDDCGYGVYTFGTSSANQAPPHGIQVSGCSFACREHGIYGAMTRSVISSNVFTDKLAGSAGGAFVELFGAIEPAEDVTISANSFANPNNRDISGVRIETGLTAALVSGNHFRMNATEAAIEFANGTADCVARGNQIFGTAPSFVDQGTHNALGKRGALLVQNGANISIAKGDPLNIPFASVDFDSEGFATADPTEITIPADRGIKRVRLSCYVALTPNTNAGDIAVILRKIGTNSNSWVGGASARVPAIDLRGEPNPTLGLNAESGIIEVAAGDRFLVTVQNYSLSSLEVQGPIGGSWFMIEVID